MRLTFPDCAIIVESEGTTFEYNAKANREMNELDRNFLGK